MFNGFEQVAVTSAVKTVSDLSVPPTATHCALQATTTSVDVRYTMDNSTAPTSTKGMVLVAGAAPELFLIEDLKRIKFTRGAGSDGTLDIHYVGS